jgi:ATP-dependent Clp protease adaptor protein ClpS
MVPRSKTPGRAAPHAQPSARAGISAAARRSAKTAPRTAPETSTRPQLGSPWSVIVWDDPVNLMSYVVYVFQKLFGFSLQDATKHMLEVHEQGKSAVASAERERAEYFVTRLHAYGLQATLERATPA